MAASPETDADAAPAETAGETTGDLLSDIPAAGASAVEAEGSLLRGTNGNDLLTGGADSDTMIGSLGNDTLHGGNSGDEIAGGYGFDLIYGEAGADALQGGVGNDTVQGGVGNDSLWGDVGEDKLDGGLGDDTVYGGGGKDVVAGGEGNDYVTGERYEMVSDGSKTLVADFSADKVEGGAGNDTVVGGSGADTLLGGDGDDLVQDGWISRASATDTDHAPQPKSDEDAVIDAGAGNDTIEVSGNDSVTTGTGADLIQIGSASYTDAGHTWTEAMGTTGTVTVTDFTLGSDKLDLSTEGQHLDADGTAIPDSYTVGLRAAGSDTMITLTDEATGNVYDSVLLKGVSGASLSDILVEQQTPPDVLTGTPGADTLDAADSTTAVTVTALAGHDVIETGAGDDEIWGGAGRDTITSGLGADTIFGGAGSDVIDDGPIYSATGATADGDGAIDAGAGSDTITVAGADVVTTGYGADVVRIGTDLTVAPTATGQTLTAAPLAQGSHVTVTDFVVGRDALDIDTTFTQTITPTGGTASTTTQDYALSLREEGGNTIVSIALPGGGVNDAVVLEGVTGVKLADILYVDKQAGGSQTGTADADDLRGSALPDTLTGGAGDDSLYGFDGADSLLGQTGSDFLRGGAGEDTVFGGAGNDSLLGELDNDLISGSLGNDTLLGGYGRDKLFGGEDDDLVSGGGGADTLQGETGKDTLDGGADNDTMRGGEGDDRLTDASGDDLFDGGAGNDRLEDTTGGEDTLLGGAGNDVLVSGLTGAPNETADSLDGGAGDDTITSNDWILSGTDSIVSPIDTLLGGDGNDLISDTWAAHVGTGFSYASQDNDALIDAGAGNDTILASCGDVIRTGAGADVIHLDAAPGLDTGTPAVLPSTSVATTAHLRVTDFVPGEDKLSIELTVHDGTVEVDLVPSLRETGGDTILVLTDPKTGTIYDEVVTLVGVKGVTLAQILA